MKLGNTLKQNKQFFYSFVKDKWQKASEFSEQHKTILQFTGGTITGVFGFIYFSQEQAIKKEQLKISIADNKIKENANKLKLVEIMVKLKSDDKYDIDTNYKYNIDTNLSFIIKDLLTNHPEKTNQNIDTAGIEELEVAGDLDDFELNFLYI